MAAYYEYLRRGADDVAAVFELPDRQLLDLATRHRAHAAVRREYASFDAGAAAAQCRGAGLLAICRHDDRYPAGLAPLPCAPPVLHCAGDPGRLFGLFDAPAAAVVGARSGSEYALEVAAGLGQGLSSAGVTVLSGMANGVDSAAHAGALRAGANTIAVLGGGAEAPYPAGKRPLHRQLIKRAAVVSEWPPGFRPRPWCFLARNRLIAALSAVTIVVEAGEYSGSLTTAAFAETFNRAVAAIPGRVTAAAAAGSNALLFDGAHMVRDARDALQLVCGEALGVTDAPKTPQPPRFQLSKSLQRLLAAIESGNGGQAALFELGDGGPQLLADLSELELLGLVRRAPGGRYVRTAQYPG